MAQVWVQVYSAQVPGSVAVEESVLRKVVALESVKVMVPMLVEVKEKEWELVPTAMDLARLEELVEVLEPQEPHLKLVKEQEMDLVLSLVAFVLGWAVGLQRVRFVARALKSEKVKVQELQKDLRWLKAQELRMAQDLVKHQVKELD